MKKFVFFIVTTLFVAISAHAQDTLRFTKENIRLFPAPSNGLFNFIVNSPGEIFTIEIYDILGEQIYRNWDLASGKKYTTDLRYEEVLDVIYFAVFINCKGEKVMKKIIINPQLNE